jgi:NapH/MauN family ferredoxin-type protein
MRHRLFRYVTGGAVLALVTGSALGYGSRSFEAFCPFGGAESLWGLLREGEFSCALGPLNLSMLIAVLVLALVAKKAFCGWACPIGFLGDLAGRLGGWAWSKRPAVSARRHRRLRWVRYLVLVGTLALTYRTGELVLRGYDPYYLVFSGFGHGTAGVISYVVLGMLIAGALVVPLGFCHYLCPLGAVLDPFSRLGLIRVHRNKSKCTGCGHCERVCPHRLPLATVTTVRHPDCTNCLECLEACSETRSLELRAGW